MVDFDQRMTKFISKMKEKGVKSIQNGQKLVKNKCLTFKNPVFDSDLEMNYKTQFIYLTINVVIFNGTSKNKY